MHVPLFPLSCRSLCIVLGAEAISLIEKFNVGVSYRNEKCKSLLVSAAANKPNPATYMKELISVYI